MANESEKPGEVEKKASESASDKGGVGSKAVGPIGIALIAGGVFIVSIVLIWGLIQLWAARNGGEGTVSPACVRIWFWSFSISDEVRLLLIVAFAGGLGGQVRSLRSLSWYVGNRELKRSWLLLYIVAPLVGAGLALVFYFVIRGGFFATGTTAEQTSEYGFAGFWWECSRSQQF
jgi:hypothetical protein